MDLIYHPLLLLVVMVVGDTYLLASSFFRQDLKEVARSTDL